MAGGSLYNNLDYSFAARRENGTYAYPPHIQEVAVQRFVASCATLREFFESLPFLRMKPFNDALKSDVPPRGVSAGARRGR